MDEITANNLMGYLKSNTPYEYRGVYSTEHAYFFVVRHADGRLICDITIRDSTSSIFYIGPTKFITLADPEIYQKILEMVRTIADER